MTPHDPTLLLPRYETDGAGGELRACWPGLAVAAIRQGTPTPGVFHELAPLPGGFFIAGVGNVDDRSSFREEVLAHVLAGTDLYDALRSAHLASQNETSACYVRFDPLDATFRIECLGPHVSALHLTADSERILGESTDTRRGAQTVVTLRAGEALVLVAHPRARDEDVPAARATLSSSDCLLRGLKLRQAPAGLAAGFGPSAILWFSRTDATSPTHSGGECPPLSAVGLDATWSTADLEFFDGLTGGLCEGSSFAGVAGPSG